MFEDFECRDRVSPVVLPEIQKRIEVLSEAGQIGYSRVVNRGRKVEIYIAPAVLIDDQDRLDAFYKPIIADLDIVEYSEFGLRRNLHFRADRDPALILFPGDFSFNETVGTLRETKSHRWIIHDQEYRARNLDKLPKGYRSTVVRNYDRVTWLVTFPSVDIARVFEDYQAAEKQGSVSSSTFRTDVFRDLPDMVYHQFLYEPTILTDLLEFAKLVHKGEKDPQFQSLRDKLSFLWGEHPIFRKYLATD